MEPYKILDIIIERYKKILDSNLVGCYLHGSLAMGCYTNLSDIDFLIVVKEPIDVKIKKELISSILHIENLPKKGIEMSIILEKYAKKFVHPTPFELHYSDDHRDKYLFDSNYICGGTTDADLAAHMTIIKHRGICLYGREIYDVFSDVPREAYINSIISDIENAKNDILDAPIYITLNLCRVLYFMKEGAICSKLEGGNWGKKSLPQKFRKFVEEAVNVYMNQRNKMEYSKEYLIEFVDYMINEINMHK